jgi:hypothetical protein
VAAQKQFCLLLETPHYFLYIELALFDIEKRDFDIGLSLFDIEKWDFDIELCLFDIEK